MSNSKWRGLALGLAGAVAASALAACSSDGDSDKALPSGKIELTVPYAAGGPTDLIARALADEVNSSKALRGNRVQVVNREGGNTATAANYVTSARADGTTVGFFSGTTFTLTPLLEKTTYNPDDMKVLARVATSGVFLGVKGDAPWKTMDEFIAAAKKDPNGISIGNAGTVSQSMSAIYAIEQAAGIELRETGFEGSAPAATALLAGDVDALVTGTSGFRSQIDSGKIRPLMSLTNERDEALPDVPSAEEDGLPDIFTGTHYVLAVPKGVPSDAAEALTKAFVDAAGTDAFAEKVKQLGSAPAQDDAKTAQGLLDTEIDWYKELFPKICDDSSSEKDMCALWNEQQK